MKRLFVGGPLHGQRLSLPRDDAFLALEENGESLGTMPDIVSYTPRRYRNGISDTPRTVMVLDGLDDEVALSMISDAYLKWGASL